MNLNTSHCDNEPYSHSINEDDDDVACCCIVVAYIIRLLLQFVHKCETRHLIEGDMYVSSVFQLSAVHIKRNQYDSKIVFRDFFFPSRQVCIYTE